MIDDPQQVEQLLKRLRIISAAPRDRHARVGCGHSGAIVRHRSTATMHHHKDVLWRRRRRHPLRARSRQGGARQGGVRRIADPSRLRSRIALGRRDRSLPEASHRTPATWRSDAFRAWATARDDTRPAASASVRERAGSGAQDNGGALSGAGGLDGRVLQPAPQRRLCAIGAARCGGAVPQTAEPGVIGATGELGLRDSLCPWPSQLPVRQEFDAAHVNAGTLRRFWCLAEHRQQQGQGGAHGARHQRLRSSLVAAGEYHLDADGLDGRSRWFPGRCARPSASAPGCRLRARPPQGDLLHWR